MSMLRMLRLNSTAARLARQYTQGQMKSSLCMSSNKWATISKFNYDINRSFSTEPGFLDRDDVSTRVLEVVKKFEKVQPEKVTTESHFVTDLGLDSLDTVELVMAFEDEFAIEIPDADAEKILTCTDAVEYLSNNIHAK